MLPLLISDTDESELIIQDLASKLGLDLLIRVAEEKESQLANDQYYLVRGKEKSHLQIGLKGKQKPILCNFTEWANNKKKSNLLRCMKGLPLDCSVVDATAGFGRDALELATVSNSVVLIERVPWLHYLLQDGIKNSTEEYVLSLVSKFELIQSDARDFFAFKKNEADVVYLDPMFPNTGSARAKKNIQALRDLSEEDLSNDLLLMALEFAKKRVIVKRHKNSGYLNSQKPSFSIQGRVVRFDVYVISSSH